MASDLVERLRAVGSELADEAADALGERDEALVLRNREARFRDAEEARAEAAEAERDALSARVAELEREREALQMLVNDDMALTEVQAWLKAARARAEVAESALAEAREVVRRVNRMATVPAAEYVPALADIIGETDTWLSQHGGGDE